MLCHYNYSLFCACDSDGVQQQFLAALILDFGTVVALDLQSGKGVKEVT